MSQRDLNDGFVAVQIISDEDDTVITNNNFDMSQFSADCEGVFTANIEGRETTTGDSCAFVVSGTAKNVRGTTIIIGGVTNIVTPVKDLIYLLSTATIVTDGTFLQAKVSGASGYTTEWMVNFKIDIN